MIVKESFLDKNDDTCNYCTRGEKVNGKTVFPYKSVTLFHRDSAGGIVSAICDDCLKELLSKCIK